MGFRRKDEPAVDRALRELDQQLKQVRRNIEQLSTQPAQPLPVPPPVRTPAPPADESMTGFMKRMLTPARLQPAVTYRARTDLFDVADKAVTQLEIDALPFTPPAPEPDLFQATVRDGAAVASTPVGERLTPSGSKLMDYLSAGSIRSYKPLRRAQREERNRFFGWIGMAAVAVWLIWVIVR